MGTIQVELAAGQRPKVPRSRFFFVGFALFALAITAVAFVPEYARFSTGKFPIASVLHIHAALMEAWVAAFVLQAWLGATGRVALHRRIGPYAIALGVAAWASMVFVEVRKLVAHPLPTELADYDELLQGVYVYMTFIALLLWALRERRRPPWHKRLILIATFVALLAPIERVEWLPEMGLGSIWASVVWINVFLIAPLITYDMVSAKRVHPATLWGLLLMLSAQALMALAWGTAPWRNFAFAYAHAVRAAFAP